MSRRLLELGNTALIVFGIYTAINWGSSFAYVAGMWFGSR